MTVTPKLKPEVEAEAPHEATAGDAVLQEYISKLIAEAAKRQPPLLSPEERHRKNQAALAVLRQWDEEDKTGDPEEIACRQVELDEFKVGMNAANTSSRILFPEKGDK